MVTAARPGLDEEQAVTQGALGRLYRDGDAIVRQGEDGQCMYVVQSGKVRVVREDSGAEFELAVMGEGDFFGEMALFERQRRSATVHALGDARVLTIDRRTLLQRIQADPSLAFRIIETLSRRVRELDRQVVGGMRAGREPG
jgi:CRP/FNR family cyclic AMP-dependent transcriptional regulator